MSLELFTQIAVVVALVGFVALVVIDKVRSGKQFMEVVGALTAALESAQKNEVTMEAVRGLVASAPPELVKMAVSLGDTLKILTPDTIDRLINAIQALVTKEVVAPAVEKPALPGTEG